MWSRQRSAKGMEGKPAPYGNGDNIREEVIAEAEKLGIGLQVSQISKKGRHWIFKLPKWTLNYWPRTGTWCLYTFPANYASDFPRGVFPDGWKALAYAKALLGGGTAPSIDAASSNAAPPVAGGLPNSP